MVRKAKNQSTNNNKKVTVDNMKKIYCNNHSKPRRNLKSAVNVAKEYSDQINRLLNYVQGLGSVQRCKLQKATTIMKEIQEIITKLGNEQKKFKVCLNDLEAYQKLLKPYKERLQEIIKKVDELVEDE